MTVRNIENRTKAGHSKSNKSGRRQAPKNANRQNRLSYSPRRNGFPNVRLSGSRFQNIPLSRREDQNRPGHPSHMYHADDRLPPKIETRNFRDRRWHIFPVRKPNRTYSRPRFQTNLGTSGNLRPTPSSRSCSSFPNRKIRGHKPNAQRGPQFKMPRVDPQSSESVNSPIDSGSKAPQEQILLPQPFKARGHCRIYRPVSRVDIFPNLDFRLSPTMFDFAAIAEFVSDTLDFRLVAFSEVHLRRRPVILRVRFLVMPRTVEIRGSGNIGPNLFGMAVAAVDRAGRSANNENCTQNFQKTFHTSKPLSREKGKFRKSFPVNSCPKSRFFQFLLG